MANHLPESTFDWLVEANGIGEKLAAAILAEYGDDTARVLIADPATVAKAIRGVSIARANAAAELMREMLAASKTTAPAEFRSTTADHWVSTTASRAGSPDDGPRPLNNEQVRTAMLERWDEIYTKRRRAQVVFAEHRDDLMDIPNVCGVHVGFRRRGFGENRVSMITNELECCLRVHVETKLAPDDPRFIDPRITQRLPDQIDGISIDVLERSYTTFEPQESAIAIDDQFEDPIVGGIQIARKNNPGGAGTLGGIVFDGYRVALITNYHVAGGQGQRIVQPADGQTPTGHSAVIGTVTRGTVPSQGGQRRVDGSIIRPARMARRIERTIKHVGPSDQYLSATLTWPDEHRTYAFKIGARTQRTTGIVQSVNATVRVNGIDMHRQILVESIDQHPILMPGDSGSFLLTEASDRSTFYVVGLVHAKTRDSGALVASHICDVETELGIKISLAQT